MAASFFLQKKGISDSYLFLKEKEHQGKERRGASFIFFQKMTSPVGKERRGALYLCRSARAFWPHLKVEPKGKASPVGKERRGASYLFLEEKGTPGGIFILVQDQSIHVGDSMMIIILIKEGGPLK